MSTFTLEDAQATSAIPAGVYEISIIKAYEDKGPIEGESEKDGIPYYIHNRRYQAKIEERISDDDEGLWEASTTFNGSNPTFTFELSVGEKFLQKDPSELVDAIPEDNEKRREMVRRNIQDTRRKAQQILRCFDEGEDFFDIVDNMVGERFNVTLSSYTKKNDNRTYYNVNFNSKAD